MLFSPFLLAPGVCVVFSSFPCTHPSACALGGTLDATIGNHILHLESAGTPRATGRAFGLIAIVRADVNNLEAAQSKTDDALTFLENAGLVIDPAFTPELVLLAGLSPLQFAVRTPKGERIYQEIKVDEPMWCLNVYRGSTKTKPFTEVELRFRGIEIVRKAIVAMATQYIESEEKLRRSEGRPYLKWKG